MTAKRTEQTSAKLWKEKFAAKTVGVQLSIHACKMGKPILVGVAFLVSEILPLFLFALKMAKFSPLDHGLWSIGAGPLRHLWGPGRKKDGTQSVPTFLATPTLRARKATYLHKLLFYTKLFKINH